MAVSDNPRPPAALPPGTRLDEFELRRVLGTGGFGIVYLAFDHALEREVAIKEYMPSSLVGRSDGPKVQLHGESHAESFTLGLRSFVNEARLLARFDAPSLVKVHRYWEANNTAYMAMPFYAGSNLHAVRRRMDSPPDEAWLRRLLGPLLDALERLHGAGIYHRDISPDNVILQPDGQPVLLDFGAARRVLSDRSVALTAILKPAYAPIEQYAEAGPVKQGAWTDLYALGATLHYMLLGRAPPPATARTVEDGMQPLARQPELLAVCSTGFLQAIDWMLKPRPADRPQSVSALREALVPRPAPPDGDDATVMLPRRDEATILMPRRDAPRNDAVSLLLPLGDEATVILPRNGDHEPTMRMPPPSGTGLTQTPAGSTRPPAGSDAPPLHAFRDTPMPRPAERQRPAVLIGAVVALLLAAMVGWLVLKPAAQPTAAAGPAAPASAPAGPASTAAAAVPGDASPVAVAADAAPADAAASAAAASAASADAAAAAATATVVPALASPAATAPAGPARAAAPAPARTEPARATNRPADTAAAKAARKEPAPARAPAPLAESPDPAPATAGGPPSLATSITRLPASDPVPVPAPARPLPELTRQAAAASAPAASVPSPALAALRAADTPVQAPRTASRDAEPVPMQTRLLGPTERCEGRGQQALAACIDRICRADPGLRDHADCVKARATR